MGREKLEVKARRIEIDILRIWCTLAICLHHLRYCSEKLPFGGGYLAVEFFFIASGFYLRKNFIEKGNTDSSIKKYILNRYIRLFKDYILAFILALCINCILLNMKIEKHFFLYIKEALMVEIGCIDSGLRMNPPDWYCGYLLLSSIIVYFLQSKIRKHVGEIGLVIGVALYIILTITYGHLCVYPSGESVISMALFRALAGQWIGVCLYEFVRRYNLRNYLSQRVIKGVTGVLMIAITYMLFWDTAYNMSDYVFVLLITIVFYLMQFVEFKSLSFITEKIPFNISDCMYVVFLNHYIVVKVLGYINIFELLDWKVISAIYLVAVYIVARIMYWMRRKIMR